MNEQDKINYLGIEIERRKKLPRAIKKSIHNVIFQNLVAAVIIACYFLVMNISFFVMTPEKFENFLKYIALIMIAITIVTFEIAYRKQSKKFMSFGIEFLCSGIISLYVPFIFLHTTVILRFIVMVIPAFLVVYYIIKSFFIFKRREIIYQSENISDVKEILKYEEEKSYLDEKGSKKYKEKKEEENKIKKVIMEEQKLRKRRKNTKSI